jgi:hypothetical protein
VIGKCQLTALRALWVTEPALGEADVDTTPPDPASPIEVALRYAAAMGWAVAPGCEQRGGGRHCGRADCLTGPPHPAAEVGTAAASRDEVTVFRWWHRVPAAPVLLATGCSFDVLEVPSYAAPEALRRLRHTGLRLGPLARDADRRLLIWLAPGRRYSGAAFWPYADLDLHRRGAGEYVTAPPAGGTRWLDPPVPYTHRVLPRAAEVLGAVVDACRQRAAAAPESVVDRTGAGEPSVAQQRCRTARR